MNILGAGLQVPDSARGALVAAMLATTLVACGSGDLSRDEAKKKLAENLALPKQLQVKVPVGMQITSFEEGDLVNALKKSSLVRPTVVPMPMLAFKQVRFDLTEQAKPLGDAAKREFTFCRLEMGEVSGVQLNGDKTQAEVEFSIVVVELNDFHWFANGSRDGPHRICKSAATLPVAGGKRVVEKLKATFAKFDDGWRVKD